MIDVDPGLLQDLVDANHILFHQGVVDAFGHVSARHPARPDRFLLARNMAPVLVTADDIIEFDLDGTAIGDTRRVYLERFIHAEIFRGVAEAVVQLLVKTDLDRLVGVGQPKRSGERTTH